MKAENAEEKVKCLSIVTLALGAYTNPKDPGFQSDFYELVSAYLGEMSICENNLEEVLTIPLRELFDL